MELSSTTLSSSSSLISTTWRKVVDDNDKVNLTNTVSNRQRLLQLNKSEVDRLLPLVVYLSLISIIGILGNGLVLHIYRTYYKRSNLKYFIVCLSVIYLFACVFVMPFEIYTVLHQYTFKYSTMCKVSRFLNTLPVMTSSFMYLAIAIDRYRKVCKPLKRQITPRWAKCICAGTFLCAMAFSWPALFVYGKNSFYIPEYDVNATECTVDNSMEGQIYPLINNLTFGVLFSVILTSLMLLYGLIGRAIGKYANSGLVQNERIDSSKEFSQSYACQYSTENDSSRSSPRQKISNILSSGGDASDIPNDSNVNTNRTSCSDVDQLNITPSAPKIDKSIFVEASCQNKSWDKSTMKKKTSLKGCLNSSRSSFDNQNGTIQQNYSRDGTLRINRSREKCARRSSILMFSITLAAILSFLPHLILMIIRATNKDFVDSMSNEGRATYKFFLRSYALTYVVIPFINSSCDARFKRGCYCIFRKMWALVKRR